MKDKKLISPKEAVKFFIDRGYNPEELIKYTPTEISVLATDMKERENGR